MYVCVSRSGVGLMCRESLINLSLLSSLFGKEESLSCQPSLHYFDHVVLLPCTYCISQGTTESSAGIIADQFITYVTFSYPTSKKTTAGDEIVKHGCRKLWHLFCLSIYPSIHHREASDQLDHCSKPSTPSQTDLL